MISPEGFRQKLHGLPISALEFRMLARSDVALPEYAGSLFRGGFGKHLRELVCRTGEPKCTGCPHISQCAYGVVFETPADPAQSALLKAYPFAPHPFVLTPPLGHLQRIRTGSTFGVHLTLIGKGRGYLAYFIEGLGYMGLSGHFGGRFRIAEVREAEGTKARIYDGDTGRLLRALPAWGPAVEAGPKRLRMLFETPLRLREKGEYTRGPSFQTLVQALVRRLHMLGCAHGPDELEWRRPILDGSSGWWGWTG